MIGLLARRIVNAACDLRSDLSRDDVIDAIRIILDIMESFLDEINYYDLREAVLLTLSET